MCRLGNQQSNTWRPALEAEMVAAMGTVATETEASSFGRQL